MINREAKKFVNELERDNIVTLIIEQFMYETLSYEVTDMFEVLKGVGFNMLDNILYLRLHRQGDWFYDSQDLDYLLYNIKLNDISICKMEDSYTCTIRLRKPKTLTNFNIPKV